MGLLVFDPPATHHDKHWISDGNIVLSAVTAQKDSTLLFRVHKSLLSDQSEVFASMFELPQGEGNGREELYEGLPLVRLHDTSEEVCALLNALRDLHQLSERTIYSDTPLRIRDALHMASKYLMTDLRARLVRIFESEWPLTVEALETKDQLLQDYLRHDDDGVRAEAFIFLGWPLHLVPEPASAIALAEDYEIKSVLPAAYYDAVRCAPRCDWDLFDWDTDYITKASDKPARWDCLSSGALRKIHRLQDLLSEEAGDRFSRLRQLSFKECSDAQSGACRKVWFRLVKESRRDVPSRLLDRDLFGQLRELRIRMSRSIDICQPCRQRLLDAILKARNRAWQCIKDECLD